jgi:protein SCO1/2
MAGATLRDRGCEAFARSFVRGKIAALLFCGLLGALPPGTARTHESVLPALERVTVMAKPRAISDFELTDQNQRALRLSSLHGSPLLIFFGFTHCPDVCPAALTKLKLMHESSNELKAARVIMISVDGERDTPAVIKKYLASLSPDFIGLTGNPAAVVNIAARFSAVAFKEQPDKNGNYNFFHSSQIFVLDKTGRLRASFSDASVENMATVTRLLLRE